MLFLRHSIIIKYDSGKCFLKIGKWSTPKIKSKKVTYSNSSLKLWIDRNYTIELISLKSYKEGLVFLVAKTLKISLIIS